MCQTQHHHSFCIHKIYNINTSLCDLYIMMLNFNFLLFFGKSAFGLVKLKPDQPHAIIYG